MAQIAELDSSKTKNAQRVLVRLENSTNLLALNRLLLDTLDVLDAVTLAAGTPAGVATADLPSAVAVAEPVADPTACAVEVILGAITEAPAAETEETVDAADAADAADAVAP